MCVRLLLDYAYLLHHKGGDSTIKINKKNPIERKKKMKMRINRGNLQ